MRRRLFIGGYLLGALLGLRAQSIEILDQQTLVPIEGVLVFTNANADFEISDKNGQVDISSFIKSNIITFRALGYETIRIGTDTLLASGNQVFMIPSLYNLEQVVVSATKWTQPIKNVPLKISSIRLEDVLFQNPQTAADLLGTSGKVYIQKSQQGGGSPMIRGFATNRLIYAVDGVRMNTAIFRSGNIQNVINLDPFAIRETEVIYGPGSVIYGSDAIGGVMSFQTLNPKLATEKVSLTDAQSIIRYSSANSEKTGHLHFNIGNQKWAGITSISHWDYDHLRQGSNGPDDYLKTYYVTLQDGQDSVIDQDDEGKQIPSGYSQLNLMQKIRFRPNHRWDFQYAFHQSQTSSFGRYDRHNRIRNQLPRYGQWDYGPQKWMMNMMEIHHTFDNRLYDELSIKLARQDFEESRINRSFGSDTRRVQQEEVLAYSNNLDFTKSISKDRSIYYGIEYVLNEVTSQGILENIETGIQAEGPSRYPNADWQSMGVYTVLVKQLSSKWSLQSGIRYNQVLIDADFDTTYYPIGITSTSINHGALTGNTGSVFQISDTWRLKVNLGTAFRSPNVDDVGKVFDSEPGAVTVPNPNLMPEYAYNLDVATTKIFSKKLKLELAGYFTFLDNAIVRRDFTLDGLDSLMYEGVMSKIQALQNASNSKVIGGQFGLEYKTGMGWSFSSDLNFQKGQEELDDGTLSPSRHAVPFFGIGRINYQKNQFDFELNSRFQGTRIAENMPVEEKSKTEIYALDENGDTYAPGWYTLNFISQYKVRDWVSVNFSIENITDQRYRPYSSGISGAGRNFVISARFSY
jgi:hemoglobin/transferrin/lactoferrin receptor protein